MDKMFKVFFAQVQLTWGKIKDVSKAKIKKIICNCKCQKTD
mgnify:FL=1